MLMPELAIRPLSKNDRVQWEPLWNGYLSFYQRRLAPEVTDFTWKRLTSDDGLFGLLAISGDDPVGIVHYLFHPSTWNRGGNCYLEDLFVVPSARGERVGRRLIAAVTESARSRDATNVYWTTEEFNGTARRLYERVAKRTPSLRYNIEL